MKIGRKAAVALTVVVLGLFAAACGDDDKAATTTQATTSTSATSTATATATGGEATPATTASPTAVPIPPLITRDDSSWSAFLDSLNAAISRADVEFLTARLRPEEGICTAADLAPGLARHSCTQVGQSYTDFPVSSGGEGHFGSVEDAASLIARLLTGAEPGAIDGRGAGALQIYAASRDGVSDHLAYFTEIASEGTLGPGLGHQRIVWWGRFAFDGANWRVVLVATETDPELVLVETTPPFPGRPDLRPYP